MELELKHIIVIAPVWGRPGRFEARYGDVILCPSTRQPLLDGARALLQQGAHPADIVVMRHQGRDDDALRSTVGAAAKLTVEEGDRGGPRLVRWKPHPRSAQ